MEQLDPASPAVMGWGRLDLLLVLPSEESGHGSLINPCEEWPHIQLHRLVAHVVFPLSRVMVLCCSSQLAEVES